MRVHLLIVATADGRIDVVGQLLDDEVPHAPLDDRDLALASLVTGSIGPRCTRLRR